MPIQSVLLSYNGRITRSDFWIKGVLVLLALSIVVGIVAAILSAVAAIVGIIVYLVFVPVAIWIDFAIIAKRFHDRGKSGWWGLVFLIPFGVGLVWIIVECGILEGNPDENAYGPKP